MRRRELILGAAASATALVTPSWAQQPGEAFWKTGANFGTGSTPDAIFGLNLIAWYKADVGVTTSGANVTAWADQSKHGNDLVNVSNNPTFSSTGFAGSKPGISFVASSGIWATGFTGYNTNNLATAYVWIVIGGITSNASGGHRILSSVDTTNGSDCGTSDAIWIYSPTSGTIGGVIQCNFPTSYALADGSNNFLAASFNANVGGGTYTPYLNGTAQTATSGLTSNYLSNPHSTRLTLGGFFGTNGEPFTAAEVGYVNVIPTSTQRTSLHTYLTSKWGVP